MKFNLKYLSCFFGIGLCVFGIAFSAHAQYFENFPNITTTDCRGGSNNFYCTPQNAINESFLSEEPLYINGQYLTFNLNGCLDCGYDWSRERVDSNPHSHPLAEMDGYRVSPGYNTIMNFADGSCKVVNYEPISGNLFEGKKNYFIPTRTQREFQSFMDAVSEFNVPISVPRDCDFCGDEICDKVKERKKGDLSNPLLIECERDCGVIPFYCGDGVFTIDEEECDTSDPDPFGAFGGASCLTIENPDAPGLYSGGTLACNSAQCEYDKSGCTICGDGVCNGLESCGDTDLPNGGECEQDCSAPSCSSGVCDCGDGVCDPDECCPEDCTDHCGNGIVETWLNEQCDPGVDLIGGTADDNLNGYACSSLGNLLGDDLACNSKGHERECKFNIGQCVSPDPTCSVHPDNNYSGNGVSDCPFGVIPGTWGQLACDSNPSWVQPTDYRYNMGTLGLWWSCLSGQDCIYDPSLVACSFPEIINPLCIAGPTVTNTMIFTTHKDWIMYECSNSTAVCDGAALEVGEICDGTLLDGNTCQTLGYDGGNLACEANCLTYDVSSCCSNIPQLSGTGCDSCPNGVIELGTPPGGTVKACYFPAGWGDPKARPTGLQFDFDDLAVCQYGQEFNWQMWDNAYSGQGAIRQIRYNWNRAPSLNTCSSLGYPSVQPGANCNTTREDCIQLVENPGSIFEVTTVHYCEPSVAPLCGQALQCGNGVVDIGEDCELPNGVTCDYPNCQTMNYCQWSYDSCHTNNCRLRTNGGVCDIKHTDYNSRLRMPPSLPKCNAAIEGEVHGVRVTSGDNDIAYECVCGQPPVIEPIGNTCGNSRLCSNGVCDEVECCGPECGPGLYQCAQDCCPYEPVLGGVCGDGDPSDPGEECDPPNGITCDFNCQHKNFCAWSYERCHTNGCGTCSGGTVANDVSLPECTPDLEGQNWGMRIGSDNYNEYTCQCGAPPVINPTTWMCGGSQTCGNGICAADECCGPECDVLGTQSICTQDCCAFAQ